VAPLRALWLDIVQGDVLSRSQAREESDERHISPLQLTVIRRCIDLWSNPGDTVYSPFAGIGSELYCAVEMGRKAIGAELKASYFRQAVANLKSVELQSKPATLFDALDAAE
jgi:DNA modification methylase